MTYRTAPLELRVVGKKWKYLVTKRPIYIQTEIMGIDVLTDYYCLTADGKLTALVGYAYNGPNWIRDSKDLMLAALWHDLQYQLIKHGHIHKVWRKYADELFRDIYIEEATRIRLEDDKYTRMPVYSGVRDAIINPERLTLTWWDNNKIQNYAKLIYFGVRVGGGFSINKSEYPEEKFLTI